MICVLYLQCYSDVTHVLRNHLDSKGYISIRISGGENSTDSNFYKMHPRIKNYKYGVAQPGVLCIRKDLTVLYSWAIEPSVVRHHAVVALSCLFSLPIFFYS